MKKKKTITLILVILAAIVMVVSVYFLVNKAETYTLDAPAYHVYYNSKRLYAAGDKISVAKDGRLILKGDKSEVTNLPIYFEDEERILLLENMAYYNEYNSIASKVDKFSIIYRNNDNQIVAQSDGAEIVLDGGFLYNGEDIYILLEPMTLEMNNYSFPLAALSYVEAVYGNGVISFDLGTKTTEYDLPKLSVLCGPSDGNYKISMIADSVEYEGGFNLLLFTNIDELDSVYSK